eukprot:TRINITY_DN6996_c0_g1_i1.p2 TRINITY_DN6996_c0_g1~~TRINITY_DN6996_c0_g1_i1.p2  ORF type:complete len:234 (+),score=69.99 TRINITY_DN6996_c0_g1_i1:471-1172(+)
MTAPPQQLSHPSMLSTLVSSSIRRSTIPLRSLPLARTFASTPSPHDHHDGHHDEHHDDHHGHHNTHKYHNFHFTEQDIYARARGGFLFGDRATGAIWKVFTDPALVMIIIGFASILGALCYKTYMQYSIEDYARMEMLRRRKLAIKLHEQSGDDSPSPFSYLEVEGDVPDREDRFKRYSISRLFTVFDRLRGADVAAEAEIAEKAAREARLAREHAELDAYTTMVTAGNKYWY